MTGPAHHVPAVIGLDAPTSAVTSAAAHSSPTGLEALTAPLRDRPSLVDLRRDRCGLRLHRPRRLAWNLLSARSVIGLGLIDRARIAAPAASTATPAVVSPTAAEGTVAASPLAAEGTEALSPTSVLAAWPGTSPLPRSVIGQVSLTTAGIAG